MKKKKWERKERKKSKSTGGKEREDEEKMKTVVKIWKKNLERNWRLPLRTLLNERRREME